MKEIIKRIKNGETQLLNDLIKDNMDFICSYTKKYKNIFEDYEELVQEAIVAFIEAVYSYDFKRDFNTGLPCIKIYYRVNKYVYENLYRITDNEKRYEIVKKLYENCKNNIGHEPTYSEFSIFYRLSRRFSKEILNIYNMKNIYMNFYEYQNYYQDYSLEKIERTIDSDILEDKLKKSNLTDKQKELVLMKFGFKDGKTYSYEKIAKKRNLKKQAMHDMFKKSEKKLKLIIKDER